MFSSRGGVTMTRELACQQSWHGHGGRAPDCQVVVPASEG